MNAATIVPQHHLHLTAWQPYHLALAHLINKPGFEQYTQFYTDIAKHPEKFVILDNGLIEGDPRPFEELVDKARQIGADEIVLPDVFQDKQATFHAVFDALVKAKQMNVENEFLFMVVPQGRNLEEWLSSARELMKLGYVNTIGIPKVVAKLRWADPANERDLWQAGWLNRLEVLRLLWTDIENAGVRIHLLGCWDTPLEIKTIAAAIAADSCPAVRGTDSAIAYAHARIGQKMSEGPRPEGAINFAATDLDADDLILKYNIQMWQAECQVDGDPIPRFW